MKDYAARVGKGLLILALGSGPAVGGEFPGDDCRLIPCGQSGCSDGTFLGAETARSCWSRGTLFQWSDDPSVTGGPDLEEPIITDRPDFTEASVTVGRGVSQLESGYTYIYNADEGASTRTHSLGEFLFRQGVLVDWLELRIGVAPVEERIAAGGRSDSVSGLSDLYLGAKFALTPQEGFLPEMAIVPQMFVPTGSGDLTSDHVEPGVNWLYGWDVNDFLSLGGSTQGNRRIDEGGESYLEMAQSFTVGYGLSDDLAAYTEWFAFIPHAADTAKTQHFFNGGFTYLINNDVQLDLRGGVGLNEAADDYFVGTGLSVRFP